MRLAEVLLRRKSLSNESVCFLGRSTWLHTDMRIIPYRCWVGLLIVRMTLNVVSLRRRHHWCLHLFRIVVVALLTKISWLEAVLVRTLESPLLTGSMLLTALAINDRSRLLLHLFTVLWPFRSEMHPLLWVALSTTENAVVVAFERRSSYSWVLIIVLECCWSTCIKVAIIVRTCLTYDTATRISLQSVMQWLRVLICIIFGCSFKNLLAYIVSAIWCVFIAVHIYFMKLI